jgi:hypothetical protein
MSKLEKWIFLIVYESFMINIELEVKNRITYLVSLIT